jgi:glycosyltransferase involved in cell wall biosynthesis
MKRSILVVAPWLPLPADFGGALRTLNLLKCLAQDHEVLLLAPARSSEARHIITLGEICDVTAVPAAWTPRHPPGPVKRIAQLRSLPSRHSFLEQSTANEQLQAVLNRIFLTRRVDLVQFEFSQMGLFQTPRPCPTVIDAHNIEHELLGRVARDTRSRLVARLKAMEAAKVRQLEERVWRGATLCVATSARDAETIASLSGTPTCVVPNGVDVAAFSPAADVPRLLTRAVFTGVMRHQPNADGARWFAREILPRVRRQVPTASLAIVGADPPSDIVALESATIQVTGRVADVRPYLQGAGVAVVPLRSGGGTRLKILEAFASGTPVVSTSLGAEGLDVRAGEHLVIADSPADFAGAVVRLMTDPMLAARLAARALDLARSSYDWHAILPLLVSAHDRAIERFHSRSSASR